MSDEDGEGLVLTPRPEGLIRKFQERRITIGDKTLRIPAYVQERMAEVDKTVAGKEIVSELFGFGLTRTTGNTTEVVDFITPQTENMFSIDSLFINQDQRRLIDILGGSQSLVLQITGNEAVMIPNDSENPSEWMHFPVGKNGQINWSFADGDVERLIGFNLPQTLDELKQRIKQKNVKTPELGDSVLFLKSDWDIIMTGGSVTITSGFIDKVQARADKIKAEIGFSMHHHPSLGIATLMSDKPESARVNYYDTLLSYSPHDVKFMKDMGVDFFEIRTLGNPDHISDAKAGTTSKFYRVEKILSEDHQIHQQIAKIR